jgi:hypothetical protein
MSHKAEVASVPLTVQYKATLCEWVIGSHPQVWVGRRGPVSQRFFEVSKPLGHRPYDHPWELRQEFLSLKTEQEVLDFLNRYGKFAPTWTPAAPIVSDDGSEQEQWEIVSGQWGFEDFMRWQAMFRCFLKLSPEKWKSAAESIWPIKTFRLMRDVLRDASKLVIRFQWGASRFEWNWAPHVGVLHAEDVVTAMLATIYVDRLSGKKFGFCVRPDCRKYFEVTSKHKRKYCTPDCAHLQTVRRLRARRKRKLKKQR